MIVTNKVGIFPLSSEWRKLSDDILKSEKFLIGQENIDVKLFFKFHLKIMIKHLLQKVTMLDFLMVMKMRRTYLKIIIYISLSNKKVAPKNLSNY